MTMSGTGAAESFLPEPTALRSAGAVRGLLLKRQLRQTLRNPSLMFGLIVIAVMLLMAVFAPLLTAEDPIKLQFGSRLRPPSAQHWFGTDDLGRDILARVMYGSRISLRVGLIVVVIDRKSVV